MTDADDGALGAWAYWPLRLLVFFTVLVALDVACQLARAILVRYAHAIPKDTSLIAGNLLLIVVMIAGYRLLVRWTENRKATELGFAAALPQLLGGILIGLGVLCAVYAILWAAGVAAFRGTAGTSGLAAAAAMSAGAAVGEEIVFRGAVYRLLEDGFGTLIAVLASGALFGFLHLGNHGATIESSIAIAIEAGILLAAAYVLTRSLWLPIGLHFGWNFAEGGIFGAAVSGVSSKGLIAVPLSGPVYLTGGPFGPEASVAAVGVGVVVAIVMLVLAAQRGEWRPMRFRLRSAAAA
jgi:uncharacterized protein